MIRSVYFRSVVLVCVALGLIVDRRLNPELANPYVLPVFGAIYPFLLPLVIVSALVTVAARFTATKRWDRVPEKVLIGSTTLLAAYLAMCLRLYPK